MPELYKKKELCTGCTACFSICPMNAITMKKDEEGFAYPKIDINVCINCGKCETVCPEKSYMERPDPIRIYAAKHNNDDVRMNSSSGGGFSLLAEWVEKQTGAIYGVTFDNQFSVKHTRAEDRDKWKKFCFSKYVQSELGETFKQVKQDLQNGRLVLFTGTPCQVEGLNRFLYNIDTSRLITCDIVCHGTASPKVWEDYLNYIRKSFKDSITKINFKDKETTGWHDSNLTICGGKSKILIREGARKNFYLQMFYRNLILRPACHICSYSNFRRSGDITLGDCWGIEKCYPRFDDNKGISLLMCNTDKGKNVWNQIRSNANYIEITKEMCIQPNLQAPSKRPKGRDEFWEEYRKYGIKRMGQKMGLLPFQTVDKIYWLINRLIGKVKRIVHLL